MHKRTSYDVLKYFIASVWIINGLYCKVLNQVPRHQLIVERILTVENARSLTILIGVAEIGMSAWIITGFQTRVNTLTQIIIIAIMNGLEFFLAQDLLLWGKANAVFAIFFICLIYYHSLLHSNKPKQPAVC